MGLGGGAAAGGGGAGRGGGAAVGALAEEFYPEYDSPLGCAEVGVKTAANAQLEPDTPSGNFPEDNTNFTETGRCLDLNQSNHVAVINSYLNDFYCTASVGSSCDAQGIAAGLARPVTLVVNLATVTTFGQRAGMLVDHRRFRAKSLRGRVRT